MCICKFENLGYARSVPSHHYCTSISSCRKLVVYTLTRTVIVTLQSVPAAHAAVFYTRKELLP